MKDSDWRDVEHQTLIARLIEQGDTITQLRVDLAEAEGLLREARKDMAPGKFVVMDNYYALLSRIDAFLAGEDK